MISQAGLLDWFKRITPDVLYQIGGIALLIGLGWFLSARLRKKTATLRERVRPHSPLLAKLLRILEASLFFLLVFPLGYLIQTLFMQLHLAYSLWAQILKTLWFVFTYVFLTTISREFFPNTPGERIIRKLVIPVLVAIFALEELGLLKTLRHLLISPFLTIGSAQISVFSLILFGGLIYLFFWVGRWTAGLLESRMKHHLEEATVHTLTTLLRYVISGLGIFIALDTIGFDLSSLKIFAGALGIGVGFGLQTLANNLISGLFLLFERSLKPGDVIQIGDLMGKVTKIRAQNTIITTLENVEILVPNSQFIASQITNLTHTSRLIRIHINVGVSYDSDPDLVRDILLRVAEEHPKVKKFPEPEVYFMEFGESSLNFQLFCWIAEPLEARVIKSDLHFRIWYALKEHGIEIPFPQRDIHLRSGIPWEELKELLHNFQHREQQAVE